MIARDVMQTNFHTLQPHQTIGEAVNRFKNASQAEKKMVFGMMVVDGQDQLVGILSMFDILLFVQPKHAHIWSEMDDMDPGYLFDELLDRVKEVQVADIMTTEVVTIAPDNHLISIADIMIKQHIRRLPVTEGREVIGIVYVSDVFYHLLNKFTS